MALAPREQLEARPVVLSATGGSTLRRVSGDRRWPGAVAVLLAAALSPPLSAQDNAETTKTTPNRAGAENANPRFELVAAEFRGFTKWVESLDTDELLRVEIPAPEEGPGKRERSNGFAYDGLMWGKSDGSAFAVQYLNDSNQAPLGDWRYFGMEKKSAFPLGTRFVGRNESIAWVSNGWNRITIRDSDTNDPAFQADVRHLERIFRISFDAEAGFRAHRNVPETIVHEIDDLPGDGVRIHFHADDRVSDYIEHDLWVFREFEGGPIQEWIGVIKNKKLGKSQITRVRLRHFDEQERKALRLPERPGSLPRTFHQYRPADPILFIDLSEYPDPGWDRSVTDEGVSAPDVDDTAGFQYEVTFVEPGDRAPQSNATDWQRISISVLIAAGLFSVLLHQHLTRKESGP